MRELIRFLRYIQMCTVCIKNKAGASFKPIPNIIIPKVPKERYVVDSWTIHKQLAKLCGYEWVIDIIDHFSKYMSSYPIEKNNGENVQLSIKTFCVMIGYPKILQTDNG